MTVLLNDVSNEERVIVRWRKYDNVRRRALRYMRIDMFEIRRRGRKLDDLRWHLENPISISGSRLSPCGRVETETEIFFLC